MSNANVPLVVDYFKDYTMDTIVAKRAIHSKNPGETAKEVIKKQGFYDAGAGKDQFRHKQIKGNGSSTG